jgi:hypothetical protein
MEKNPKFDGNTSVREIIRNFPGTRRVFDTYGLMGCGGPEGPTEPLSLFARVHQTDLEKLMAQLQAAVENKVDLSATSARGAESMHPSNLSDSVPASADDPRSLPRTFIRSATVAFMTGGCLTGAIFLIMISRYGTFEVARLRPGWTAHVQGHGHVQLSGWLALFVMGIAYFALPRFLVVDFPKTSTVRTSYGLMIAGILLRIFYQPFSAERWAGNWVFLGAAAEFAASVLFLRIVNHAVRASSKKHEPYVQYLKWGAGWLVVSQAILLVHSATAVVEARAVILGRTIDEAYLHTMLMGFAGLFILGVTLRTIPLVLDFHRRAGESLQRFVLAAWNAGVMAFAAGQLMRLWNSAASPYWVLLGAWLELAAGAAFLLGVNPFQKNRAARQEKAEDVPAAWLWIVRSAFLWMAVALVMETVLTGSPLVTGRFLAQPYWGAFRHALTVGWISMMIFGMAYRMIPVMEGRTPAWKWTAPLVFWLANMGALGRVTLETLSVTHPGVIAWVGTSGVVELSAGVLFTVSVWRTMRASNEPAEASETNLEIGPDTNVARVLAGFPESLAIFIQHGFTALQNPVLRAVAAKMVTIAQACRMHGIGLEALLDDLNSHQIAMVHNDGKRTKPESDDRRSSAVLVQLTPRTANTKQ